MNLARLKQITSRYASLRIAIVGDFCLDRYLEIDPRKQETSLETGLPVHNVVNVRGQPGAAGTILNNLVALGIGEVFPVGFCGEDGEGFELKRALAAKRGVKLRHFLQTRQRSTFTYCKPLLLTPGKPPRELNRLDSKNWTPTPPGVQQTLANSVLTLAARVHGFVVLDQVDLPETGVVTRWLLLALHTMTRLRPRCPIIADSRRGLGDFPPLIFKMNVAELAASVRSQRRLSLARAKTVAQALAQKNRQPVFITLARQGILVASPSGEVERVSALPVRGPIDIVGAGDAVTANLAAALAAGATLREAIELANGAASVVIHQLGTTGTASVPQIREVLV
jgi:rfaE bifunctional protein kinase chain/domain